MSWITISLGPSGNIQGGFKFMALNTGKKIIRYSWDRIPMPNAVIARVNALAQDQPKQLVFTDYLGRAIGDVKVPGVGLQRLASEYIICWSLLK